MPRTIYIVLQLLLVLVLLLARNVVGNEIIDPCADPTSPSYNQTQASRPWHAVASALSMPKGAKAFTFIEKKIECIKFQLDLLSINQALGSIDTTIDIEFQGQLFDTCSTAPAHYLLKIDEKSLISDVLTIPSPEVQQVLMAPLSLKGTYKTAAKNGEFKLQISDMTFESESDPFDQQDYEWHNKIEGTNCTLQGHFKDAQNIVQSTRPMHLALSLPDGRNYVFVMHEGISASAARAENTVLFENCPCDVKTLAAQNKKEQCNPYNV